MILTVGLQILVISALGLAVLLIGYTIYVRVRQETFTEKRFNFVALWSCLAVVTIAFHVIFDFPVLEVILAEAGLAVEPAGPWTKAAAAFLAAFYIWTISRWAASWDGRLTEEGYHSREQRIPTLFIVDGAKETLRILKREPSLPVRRETGAEALQLPPPLPELPFHEQVRELMVGRWPELVIDDDAWIGDGCCWKGLDAGINQPLLVLCGTDEGEVDIRRIQTLIAHLADQGRPGLRAVFETYNDRGSFSAALGQVSEGAQVMTFDELVTEAVPLARYKREVRRQFEDDPLPGANFPIADVLVPACAYKGLVSSLPSANDEEPIDLEAEITEWLADARPRHLALLGTYGQGKSTAALALTYKLLFDADFATRCQNRIPLLIRLTGLSPKTSNPEALLGQWGSRLGLNGRALLALHRAGRTLLILDAFDEMANVSDRADRFDHFGSLWQLTSPGAKVLFTGRPNFFLDDDELKRALGILEGVAVGPYCSALRLAAFNEDQIAVALRWMPEQATKTFLQQLKKLPQILEIARRPSLLFQLTQLWHMGRINLDSPSIYSGTVIRAFVTYSLERQIEKQRSEIASGRHDRQFIPLTLAELDYFTVGCAMTALSGGRNNSLPAPVLRSTVSRMLQSVGEQALPLSVGEGGALAMPLRERLADKPEPIDSIVQAVRTHGVIEHDLSKPGLCKFSHKSFAEVLAAEALTAKALQLPCAHHDLNILLIRQLSEQDAILRLCMDIAASCGTRAHCGDFTSIVANLIFDGRREKALVLIALISPLFVLYDMLQHFQEFRSFNETSRFFRRMTIAFGIGVAITSLAVLAVVILDQGLIETIASLAGSVLVVFAGGQVALGLASGF